VEREAEERRRDGALRALLAAVVLSGCAHQVALGASGATDRSLRVRPSVRCDTGHGTIELTGWRAQVEAEFLASQPATTTTIDGAELVCRTVILDSRPVIVGANRPSVLMMQTTELELQIEVRWTTVDASTCVEGRWLGRSRWRIVPRDPDSDVSDALTEAVGSALHEAVENAALEREVRQPCPASL
jgi:hypothetical protein